MRLLLDVAWPLVGLLKYTGLAAALIGIVIFGWFFVRGNAQSESGDVPSSSWRGPGPMLGAKILMVGTLLEIASIGLAVLLPGRL